VNSRVQIQTFVVDGGVVVLACLRLNISCCIWTMNTTDLQSFASAELKTIGSLGITKEIIHAPVMH
jgi:hypothetical protein